MMQLPTYEMGDKQYGGIVTADKDGLAISGWYESGTSWNDYLPWGVIDDLRRQLAELNTTTAEED